MVLYDVNQQEKNYKSEQMQRGRNLILILIITWYHHPQHSVLTPPECSDLGEDPMMREKIQFPNNSLLLLSLSHWAKERAMWFFVLFLMSCSLCSCQCCVFCLATIIWKKKKKEKDKKRAMCQDRLVCSSECSLIDVGARTSSFATCNAYILSLGCYQYRVLTFAEWEPLRSKM